MLDELKYAFNSLIITLIVVIAIVIFIDKFILGFIGSSMADIKNKVVNKVNSFLQFGNNTVNNNLDFVNKSMVSLNSDTRNNIKNGINDFSSLISGISGISEISSNGLNNIKQNLLNYNSTYNPNKSEFFSNSSIEGNIEGNSDNDGNSDDFSNRMEIKNNMQNQLNFNDQLNYNTSNNLDPVDKINLFRENNGQGTDGQNISDVFNNIVEAEANNLKHCKYPKCIIPGFADKTSNSVFYKDESNTITNYNTRYETDSVMNGGKFYDMISGYDSVASKYFSN